MNPKPLLHWFCSPNRFSSMVSAFQNAIDLVAQYATTLPGHGSAPKIALVYNQNEGNEEDFDTRVKTNLTFNGAQVNAEDFPILLSSVTQQL